MRKWNLSREWYVFIFLENNVKKVDWTTKNVEENRRRKGNLKNSKRIWSLEKKYAIAVFGTVLNRWRKTIKKDVWDREQL